MRRNSEVGRGKSSQNIAAAKAIYPDEDNDYDATTSDEDSEGSIETDEVEVDSSEVVDISVLEQLAVSSM